MKILKKINSINIGFVKLTLTYMISYLYAVKMIWTDKDVYWHLSLTQSDTSKGRDIYAKRIEAVMRRLKGKKLPITPKGNE